MRSADEVALVNAVYGTYLNTCAASGAKRVVDSSEIILHSDRAVRTGLLTLHTTDTAVGAILTYVCALIVI